MPRLPAGHDVPELAIATPPSAAITMSVKSFDLRLTTRFTVSASALLCVANLIGAPVIGNTSSSQALYVSTNGTAGNPGTADRPVTLMDAIDRARPGMTIYLRGGTYFFTNQVTVERTNSGAGPAFPKRMFAYPGEKPRLDFSSQPYGRTSRVSNPRGLQLNGHWWHLRGLEVSGAADNGIYVAGNSNIVERCITHHNRDTGLQIGRDTPARSRAEWPAYNLILNCDSFDNYDAPPNRGENADGFACKLTSGPGNVFRGCVARNNIDDGWDLFTKLATGPIDPVVIDQCIAYANGILSDGTTNKNGDRNGFKLGGSGIAVNHVVTRSIAFGNLKNGFTWNSNPGRIRMINNLAFDNARGNFKFDVEGPLFLNNVSIWTRTNATHSDRHGVSGSPATPSNYWWNKSRKQPNINARGLIVTTRDFLSLTPPADGFQRLEDGSLVLGDFARPTTTSPLIDAGEPLSQLDLSEPWFVPADVYFGSPDIGPIEKRP
jgi:hypothetical protein